MKNSQFIWTSYLMSFEVIFFIIRTETVPFACSLCGVPACAGVQLFTNVCVVCVIANKPIQNIYLLFCLLFSFRISRTVCVACTIKLPFFIFSKLKTFFFSWNIDVNRFRIRFRSVHIQSSSVCVCCSVHELIYGLYIIWANGNDNQYCNHRPNARYKHTLYMREW